MFNWLPWEAKALLSYIIACGFFILRGEEMNLVNSLLVANLVLNLVILIQLDKGKKENKR